MTRDEFNDTLYLAHHGVKGQRWGIRRYQNEDGTLTARGKARDKKDSERGNEKGKERAKTALKIALATAVTAGAVYAGKKIYDTKFGPGTANSNLRLVNPNYYRKHLDKVANAFWKQSAKEAGVKYHGLKSITGEKSAKEIIKERKNTKNVKNGTDDYLNAIWEEVSAKKPSVSKSPSSTQSSYVDYNAQILEALEKMREMGRTGKKSK